MNKKIVILIVIVECIAAILLVSFWGKMIESLHPVVVATAVYITDGDGNRYEEGSTINIELTDSVRTYQLHWEVSPSDASNKAVEFLIDDGDDDPTNDDDDVIVSDSGLVTFFVDRSIMIIVRTKDGSQQRATIILSPVRD